MVTGLYQAAILVCGALLTWSVDQYHIGYLIFLSCFILISILERDIFIKVFLASMSFYLLIGLLNISTYRNYISVSTIKVYAISYTSLLLPMLIFRWRNTQHLTIVARPLFYYTAITHILICYIALAYVYAAIGPIIINQDLRFKIPTALGYTIRSCQFIPLFMLSLLGKSISSRQLFWLTLAAIAPSALIASRSTVLLVFFAMFIFWLYKSSLRKNARIINTRTVVASVGVFILALVFISGGFYLRRAGTDQLIDGSVFVETFMGQYPGWLTYPLAPLHQGFNETAALTSRVVDNGYKNYFTDTPLLLADFDNLLGRSSVSAAQYFGDLIGRAQAGGLTPGLVGGVLLDFPSSYPLIFSAIGLCVVLTRGLVGRDIRWALLHSIVIVNMIHLFHRGFMKPEYITAMLICVFYILLLRCPREE